ncbi:MAG: hypothetical protein NT102_01465 [Caldiserica bacterium]|nr:hypothetical protein [Caldisericota bacterium]
MAQALKDSKEIADARVVMFLYQRALACDVTSCIWGMKNKIPDKWYDRREVNAQVTGPAGKGTSVEEVARQYADEFKGMLEGDPGCTPKRRRESNDGGIGVQARKRRGDGSS